MGNAYERHNTSHVSKECRDMNPHKRHDMTAIDYLIRARSNHRAARVCGRVCMEL